MYFVAFAVEDVERRFVDVAVLLRLPPGRILEVKMNICVMPSFGST